MQRALDEVLALPGNEVSRKEIHAYMETAFHEARAAFESISELEDPTIVRSVHPPDAPALEPEAVPEDSVSSISTTGWVSPLLRGEQPRQALYLFLGVVLALAGAVVLTKAFSRREALRERVTTSTVCAESKPSFCSQSAVPIATNLTREPDVSTSVPNAPPVSAPPARAVMSASDNPIHVAPKTGRPRRVVTHEDPWGI
jgi:hypothetical protein